MSTFSPEQTRHRPLAVDGNHSLHGLRQALRPGEEAGLKAIGVESAEDEAELIVARRAVREGQEAAQKRQLLSAEQRR